MVLGGRQKIRKGNPYIYHGPIDPNSTISILRSDNPKQLGSATRNRFKLYREGARVSEFLMRDVRWDFGHGFIAVDGKTVSEISGRGSDSKSVRRRGREKPNEAHGPAADDFDPSNYALVLQAEIEKQHTESALIPPNLNWRIAQRREARLVTKYARAMKDKGIS